MEGQGGFATTRLTAGLNNTAVTVNVISTNDFLDIDYIWIGDERITYAAKTDTSFTGCTRGTDGTPSLYHAVYTKVYNEGSNVMYNALGFNVAVSDTILGTFWTLSKAVLRVTKIIPRAIAWDYSFLTGGLTVLKYLLYCLSAGMILTLAMYFRNLILGQ